MNNPKLDSILENIGLYKIETITVNQTQTQFFAKVKELAFKTTSELSGFPYPVNPITIRRKFNNEMEILSTCGNGKNQQDIVIAIKNISTTTNTSEIEIHGRPQYSILFSLLLPIFIAALVFSFASYDFISKGNSVILVILLSLMTWLNYSVSRERIFQSIREFIILIE